MPSFKKISRKTSVLIAVAALSSGMTYLICHSQYSDEIEALNDKIRLLEESERKAVVTQRISEQMEDIAYQSKSLADTALQRAVFERGKAQEQTHRAEQERHNALVAKGQADVAEQEARNQAQKAEYESKLAQQARFVAETEKSKADTMRFLSLGRSLAQASITQYGIAEKEIASLLAFSAYTFTCEYGGDPYQQDVFTSLLYSANNARNRIASFKGNVRALECIERSSSAGFAFSAKNTHNKKGDKNILVATDYGEIGLLTPHNTAGSSFDGFDNTLLFSNNKCIFRDMCVKDSMAYILDVNGRITAIKLSNGYQSPIEQFSIASTTHPAERWSHILLKKNGQLIAVGEHQVVWFDPKTHAIIREHYINDNIQEAGIGDGKLLIFTDKEKHYTFKEGVPSEWPFDYEKHCTITAYHYLKNKHLHVVGTNIGKILMYDDNGKLKYTLSGHSAPITHIDGADWCLVSSSYDKTVRIWDLTTLGELNIPLEMKCPAWPLTFDIDPTVSTLRLGYSDGGVETVRYSAEDNAASIQRHLKRDFTPAEWQYYVGQGVPYRTFK